MNILIKLSFLAIFLVSLCTDGESQLSNYTFSCSRGNPYNPITGSPGPTGDDQVIFATMPFSFGFLGTNYTHVTICTNGWVALGVTTQGSFNGDICTTIGQLHSPYLAPFWDDLNQSAGGNIQYGTIGTAPNRKFIVQYTNVGFFSGTGNVTFQLILNETSNVIQFLYGPAAGNNNASGSVGIRRLGGGSGNYISVRPGPTCDSTFHSSYICYDGMPYNPISLASGVLYTFGPLVGINVISGEVPKDFKLGQNYPNPFNPKTIINFQLSMLNYARLVIYDMLGREIETLVNEKLKPGTYEAEWNAENYPSGVYYYSLTVRQAGSSTGDYADTKKMVLIK